ncbi:hypothetical protein GIW81_10085 [Hyphomicrobium sp. xq]|uniref:Capsule polysaccharide biosynthesis protein n=1 Tax=Hyphomicrobium album TaxID=2665159 RepID=A0A6I3KJS7_9HYPH|nr:hypothetical protein [Hyphomicrobium album]MTD94679.1 hypothetical protein [Hyphomicrobium album]
MTKLLLSSSLRVLTEAVSALEREGDVEETILATFGAPHGEYEGWEHIDHALLLQSGLNGTFEGVDLRYLSVNLLESAAPAEKYIYQMMDRVDPLKNQTHAQRRFLYHYLLCYWAATLEAKKPDAVLFGSAPHEVSDFVLYAICKSRDIRTLIFNYTRLPGICFLGVDFSPSGIIPSGSDGTLAHSAAVDDYVAKLQKDYATAIPTDAKEILHNFESEAEQSRPRLGNLKTLAGRVLNMGRAGLALLAEFQMEKIKEFAQHRLNGAEWSAIKLEYAVRASAFKKPRRYVYFLLNFQPESTTSPLGRRFVDQYLAVAMIAKFLPADYAIVVKEHPVQFVNFSHYNHIGRDKNYYGRLARIQGVTFAPFEADHFELLDGSMCVASVNGTVGWEAVVRKKPAMVFGEAWYQDAPGVLKVESDEDCARAITQMLGGVVITDDMIRGFLEGFMANCSRLSLNEEDARIAGVPFDFDENVAEAKRMIRRGLRAVPRSSASHSI